MVQTINHNKCIQKKKTFIFLKIIIFFYTDALPNKITHSFYSD